MAELTFGPARQLAFAQSKITVIKPSSSWTTFAAQLEQGSPLLAMLTPAEREVTMHLRLGLSNKEIATALGKSPATVKAQVASILSKLDVATRCRLIAWLHEHAVIRCQS